MVDALPLGEGAEMDVNTTWAQIGRAVLIETGAHKLAYARDYVQFDTRGAARRNRRVFVQLAGDDTYSVGIGYYDRKAYDFVWLATLAGVYCDALRETILRLYGDHAL